MRALKEKERTIRAERTHESQTLDVAIQSFKTFVIEIIFHPLIRSHTNNKKRTSKGKPINY